MAIIKRGDFWYGDTQADIRAEVGRYSGENAYAAQYFADATCACGNKIFMLQLDDQEGAAVRTCTGCSTQHPIGDSEDFLEDAVLEVCACPCGGEEFEITAGVSLYDDSQDVRWLYLGCRCIRCGLTAVYGDWKNEYIGYQNLLQRI